MKNLLLVCLMVCSNLYGLSAQGSDFAPLGAKWYYSELDFALRSVPLIMESVSKEIYQGKLCSKLVVQLPSVGPLPSPTYVYSQNDTVFFYSNITNQFEMLYDFTAEVGDQWVVGGVYSRDNNGNVLTSDTITVDSMSLLSINGGSLKVWHISHGFFYDWGRRIVEKVGNLDLFAPKYAMWELQVGDLRCFETPDTAFHFVSYPCDTVIWTISGTQNLTNNEHIKVSPNPFKDQINLSIDAAGVFDFSLYDQLGRLIGRYPGVSDKQEIPTGSLSSGLYFWQLERAGVLIQSGKCLKE